MKDIRTELLAPAGNMEALFAAIQSGANAVYLGGKLFNARQFASNFDYEELELAVNYAHLRNAKVYITVNILIDDKEMRKALDYIRYLYEIDVDGIIVQDLGLAYLVKSIFPKFRLHASTQMTINNLSGVLFLESFGFDRVVLARETPLKEIRHISANANIELEGFVHGALCISYSGQCLMSSIIGGRSGNRGKCAQPCRMAYSIIDYNSRQIRFPEWNEKYLLSPKDLNTLEHVEKLVESGLTSLKIEGRMKRPEYVAIVVKNYRKTLDLGYDYLTDTNKDEIRQLFNRDFTKGLMLGEFGKAFISYDRPDNRGILIGKVVKIDNNYAYIKLYHNVDRGDGIELKTKRGNYIGNVLGFSASEGAIIKIDRIVDVSCGSKVYRTSSSKLLRKAKASYKNENIKYPISMTMEISIGKPAELSIGYNNEVFKIQSDYIVEKAERVQLTRERVQEQLGKLNDTVYYLDDVIVKIDNNSFMPISEINQLRRKGIEKVDDIRKHRNKQHYISDAEYYKGVNRYFEFDKREKLSNNLISVSVATYRQFEQLDLNKLDRIYIGFSEGLEEAILKVKEGNKEVYLVTDKILYNKDLEELNAKLLRVKSLIDGVSVANLGTLQFIKDNFKSNIHGDMGLNVFNSFTVKSLEQIGLRSVTLSPELNIGQIKTLCNHNLIDYEAIGYGYLPLMTTRNCPMSFIKDCTNDADCKSCPYSVNYGLRDRKGIEFYMERKGGFTTIYNGFPLMILDTLHQVYENGVDIVRLDFTFEQDGIGELQDVYYDYANMKISQSDAIEFIRAYRDRNNITKGHYFRGVL